MSFAALARMLGIKPHQAEDALHSERAARAVLSRRDLFATGSALAVGSAFSFAVPARPTIELIAGLFAESLVNARHQLAAALRVPETILHGIGRPGPLAEETDEQLKARLKRMILEEVRKR